MLCSEQKYNIFFCIALVAISVLAYKQVNIRIVETKADFERYTLNEIENISKVIIKGSLGGESEQTILDGEDGQPVYWETATEILVNQTFKSDNNIRVGDSIIVVEPYAIWRNPGGAFMLATEGYRPLSKNNEYVLFLVDWDDRYQIVGVTQGKHVIHRANEPLTSDLIEVGDVDLHYFQLHEEVVKNYFTER